MGITMPKKYLKEFYWTRRIQNEVANSFTTLGTWTSKQPFWQPKMWVSIPIFNHFNPSSIICYIVYVNPISILLTNYTFKTHYLSFPFLVGVNHIRALIDYECSPKMNRRLLIQQDGYIHFMVTEKCIGFFSIGKN